MIKMIHERGRQWYRAGRTWAKGFAVYKGTYYSGLSLAELTAGIDQGLPAILPQLHGEFALAKGYPDGSCELAVDRIRSIPLFYSTDASRTVSDDVELVAAHGPAIQPADHLKLAFLLQGTTIGRDTLKPAVKQVRAGECVRLSSDGATRASYFELGQRAQELAGLSESNLISSGIETIESSFQRMLRSSDGPFVVPLSGGLDSRLVVTMLHRLGRTDTLCFSYGDVNSFEARSSRSVAERLGLAWTFVDYSHSKWNRWASSPEFRSFATFASQHCAIEHEQDWPAVHELCQRGTISEQSVFVPGHSGDFLAGSHLPEAAFGEPREGNAVDWILAKYMTQWPLSDIDVATVEQLREEVRKVLPTGPPALKFDDYGWRHRQAMMIANSVRAYEHHGFDWRLPLWDEEMISFWSSIPLRYRRNKTLYLKVLNELLADLMQIPYQPVKPSVARRLRGRLTDDGYWRYGMFTSSKWASTIWPMSRALHPQGAVASAAVRPWRRFPILRARINGLLALGRLEYSLSTS